MCRELDTEASRCDSGDSAGLRCGGQPGDLCPNLRGKPGEAGAARHLRQSGRIQPGSGGPEPQGRRGQGLGGGGYCPHRAAALSLGNGQLCRAAGSLHRAGGGSGKRRGGSLRDRDHDDPGGGPGGAVGGEERQQQAGVRLLHLRRPGPHPHRQRRDGCLTGDAGYGGRRLWPELLRWPGGDAGAAAAAA